MKNRDLITLLLSILLAIEVVAMGFMIANLA